MVAESNGPSARGTKRHTPEEPNGKNGRARTADAALLREGTEMLMDYVEKLWAGGEQAGHTVQLSSPKEIEAAFDAVGCSLDIGQDADRRADTNAVMEACKVALKYSVRTNHPKFFNQLYGRVEPVGLLGQLLTSIAAGNCHTYEIAPVFTLTEVHVLRKFMEVVGYPQDGDGLFTPGGSYSNLYGMHLARFKACPQIKAKGLWACPPLVAFTSAQAHYSYAKSSHVLGLGTENLIKVECDDCGRMKPSALREAAAKAKADGKLPFFVGATMATTVLGAFDDMVELKKICDEFKMWLHVDACWGATAVLASSPEVKALARGLDATDSMAWNPHKAMGMPIACSVFLTRYPNILRECNAANAAYLFQPDKNNKELDIGDKTIQCGRLPDSFKIWLAWKHLGDQGFKERTDKAVDLIEHVRMRMEGGGSFKGHFKLVIQPQFLNICFWYFPPSIKEFDAHAAEPSSESYQKLHKVAIGVKNKMQEDGKALIGFQSVPITGEKPLPNFFRLVLPSVWSVSKADLDSTLADIDNIGCELFP